MPRPVAVHTTAAPNFFAKRSTSRSRLRCRMPPPTSTIARFAVSSVRSAGDSAVTVTPPGVSSSGAAVPGIGISALSRWSGSST